MCCLLAHLWVPLALLWIAIRHRAWRGLLPFVALIALEVCIGWVLNWV